MSNSTSARSLASNEFPVQTDPQLSEAGNQSSFWSVAKSRDSLIGNTQLDVTESGGAAAAAEAARALARAIPEEVRNRWYAEHAYLVEKQFVGELESNEFNRLRYLRWQIDRFQDADIGDALDNFNALVAMHESIAAEVSKFAEHATKVASQGNRAAGRRR